MAPMIWFKDGPESNGFKTHLLNTYWDGGGVPTFVADGVYVECGMPFYPELWTPKVDYCLSIPTDLNIETVIVGDSCGGSITYTLTAEQDLGTSPLKLYSAIVQSNAIASPAFEEYSGETLHYIPKVFPCGTTGTAIEFTGPYPQTIQVTKSYILNPSEHILDDLDLASFVVNTTSKKVVNAAFRSFSTTGIYEEETPYSTLGVWPNPTNGAFTVSSTLPAGMSGTLHIFDVAGRSVGLFDTGFSQNMSLAEVGVYFIRLTTSTGEHMTRQIVVVK